MVKVNNFLWSAEPFIINVNQFIFEESLENVKSTTQLFIN